MLEDTDRRNYLKKSTAVASAALVGLSGCLGDNGNGGGDDDDVAEPDEVEDDGEFPERQLRFVIPFGQGGSTDNFTRQIIPEAVPELGQPVQIENQPGAASLEGLTNVVNSDHDGYTFVGFNPPSSPASWLINQDDVNWDIRDFNAICGYTQLPYTIFAGVDENIDGFEDLKERYNSGEYTNLGVDNLGGITHLQALMMQNDADWEWSEVIGYDGGGPTIEAISGGEVPAGIAVDENGIAAVEDDLIEPVAILNSSGSSLYPEADNYVDLGYQEHDELFTLNNTLWVHQEVDENRRQTLEDAMRVAIESDPVQEWADDTGREAFFVEPEDVNETLEDLLELIPEQLDLDQVREDAGAL